MKEISAYDILLEDPIIPSQQYALFSYLLPDPKRNELHRPMIKFRGAYRTRDEAKHNAQRLSKLDEHQYVNIYEIQVGAWGNLFTPEEIENQDIDIQYSNELMQEMMQGYRDQKDKVDTEYSERKKYRKEQLEFDSSKEGQKYLNDMEEHIIAVKDRLEKYKEDLKINIENLVYVEKRLKCNLSLDTELNSIKNNEKFADNDDYLKEQINSMDEEITSLEERIKTLKESKDIFLKSTIDERIKKNKDLIDFGNDNKKYITNKIDELKANITKTQELIKEKEMKEDKKIQDRLNKESLLSAAKNLTLK